MKILLASLCLILLSYSVWMTLRWFPGPPEFTGVITQKTSPDGSIIASYVIQEYGPMMGITYGLTLAGTKETRSNPIRS